MTSLRFNGYFSFGPLRTLSLKGKTRFLICEKDYRRSGLEITKALIKIKHINPLMDRVLFYEDLESIKYIYNLNPTIEHNFYYSNGRLDIFRFFLEKKEEDYFDDDLVFEMASNGYLAIVRYLIKKGYNLESALSGAIDGEDPRVALFLAGVDRKAVLKHVNSNYKKAMKEYEEHMVGFREEQKYERDRDRRDFYIENNLDLEDLEEIEYREQEEDEEWEEDDLESEEYMALEKIKTIRKEVKKSSEKFTRTLYIRDLLKSL